VMERTKHTTVWVDAQPCGEQDSLAAPHIYDLSALLTSGAHRLTVRVDNSRHPPVSGHQLSDDTQTDWNGILGRIELQATDKIWLEDVQVYPDASARQARVRLVIGNLTGEAQSGSIELSATKWNSRRNGPGVTARAGFECAAAGSSHEVMLHLGPQAELWDEFSPALYRLSALLEARVGRRTYRHRVERTFGLRQFTTQGTQFVVNGRTIFLRGKHDACVFPLTGYAPMELAGWQRYFETCRAYGINHIRFHTWCPPEAAFEAADLAGMYLQPELPNFGGDFSKDLPKLEYSRLEGRRILQAFGNHPSFAMFALGNENFGGRDTRAEMIRELRRQDPRHLYAQASNYEFSDPRFAEGDDYWTTMRTVKGAAGNVRGSFSHADKPLGRVQTGPAGTAYDYGAAIAQVPAPVIGHEVGQYQVFPRFAETAKYTGVLQARNFEIFRDRLSKSGMLDQNADFVRASGALSALCYREEIETALRTRGFGGFQLLDLQDFPGQGTALVGMLDAFMDSKGLISSETWREFCSATAPLARFSKYTWTTDEEFSGSVQVANYGPTALRYPEVLWNLKDAQGKKLASGRLKPGDIPQGTLFDAGRIQAPLRSAAAPAKLQLTLAIRGSHYQNHYPFWVYPAKARLTEAPGVTVARALDEPTCQALARGGRVVLIPDANALTNSIEGFFASDFWCFPMFRQICEGNRVPPAPGTLGLLIQEKHPALAGFPTEYHSNWQWHSLLLRSRALILDRAPVSFRPIAQVIDNFERNHKLGLIFEAKVGQGKLLVCGVDLQVLDHEPEARQLLSSLLTYAASDQFRPSQELTPAVLAEIVR